MVMMKSEHDQNHNHFGVFFKREFLHVFEYGQERERATPSTTPSSSPSEQQKREREREREREMMMFTRNNHIYF
jgi:hypothetical protein